MATGCTMHKRRGKKQSFVFEYLVKRMNSLSGSNLILYSALCEIVFWDPFDDFISTKHFKRNAKLEIEYK